MSRIFLGAALASLASASYMPSELVERQTTCATGVHLMIAGGCHLPCPSNEPGLLSSLIGDVVGAIPGTDQYFVPYDNSTQQGAVSTPLMIKAVESYIATCPDTPIVLLGYSLGGIITTNTLSAIPYSSNILASITYGQETYTYPEPYDVGTCTENAPLYPRANTAPLDKFAPVMQQYCDSADAACCTGGTSTAAHFEYASFYDQKALAFIQGKYALFPKSTTTSSSSSSTSTSSTSASSATSATTTGTGSAPVITSSTPTSVAPVVPLSTGGSEPYPTIAPGVYSNTTTVVPVIGSATGSSVVVFMTSAIPVSDIEGVGSATATTTIVVGGQTYTVTEGTLPTGTEGVSVSLVTTTIPIYATSYKTVVPPPHKSSGPSGSLAPYNPSSTLTPFAGGAAQLPAFGFASLALALLAGIALL